MHDPHDEVGLHLLPDDERHAGLLLLIRELASSGSLTASG
jgi:hypothetical protein